MAPDVAEAPAIPGRTPRTPMRRAAEVPAESPAHSARSVADAEIRAAEALLPPANPFKGQRRADGLPVGRPFQKGQKPPDGVGRPQGSLNRTSREIRERARRFLESKWYRRILRRRLREGTLPAMVEVTLYHYAYGKPADRIKVQGTVGTYDLPTLLQQAAALRSARVVEGQARALPAPAQNGGNGAGPGA